MGSPIFFGAIYCFLDNSRYINGRGTVRFLEKKIKIQSSLAVATFLIHTFASFHYGQLKNTFILTFFHL